MNEKEKALEKWHLEKHLHLPRMGSDATEGFEAGWEAAIKSLKKCQSCGKKHEVHPSMYDCHSCRTKHY